MPVIEIKRRRPACHHKPASSRLHEIDTEVLYQGEHETFAQALEAAVKDGVDLREVNLVRKLISFACLKGAKLHRAHMMGVEARGANFEGADLSGADMRGCYLKGANCDNADFSNAHLFGADFLGASIRGACFGFTDLSGCRLGSHLDGATYCGVPMTRRPIVIESSPRVAIVDAHICCMHRAFSLEEFMALTPTSREIGADDESIEKNHALHVGYVHGWCERNNATLDDPRVVAALERVEGRKMNPRRNAERLINIWRPLIVELAKSHHHAA